MGNAGTKHAMQTYVLGDLPVYLASIFKSFMHGSYAHPFFSTDSYYFTHRSGIFPPPTNSDLLFIVGLNFNKFVLI